MNVTDRIQVRHDEGLSQGGMTQRAALAESPDG